MNKVKIYLFICGILLVAGCKEKTIDIPDEYTGKGSVMVNNEKWEGVAYVSVDIPFSNFYNIIFRRKVNGEDVGTVVGVDKIPFPVKQNKYYLSPSEYFYNYSIGYDDDSVNTAHLSTPSSLGNDVSGSTYNIMKTDSNSFVEILSYNDTTHIAKGRFQFTVFKTEERTFFPDNSIKVTEGFFEAKVKYLK